MKNLFSLIFVITALILYFFGTMSGGTVALLVMAVLFEMAASFGRDIFFKEKE